MKQIVVEQSKYEKYARLLETTTFRQIQHRATDGANGRCAIGVLVAAGYNLLDDLSPETYAQIILLNDFYGFSFDEIGLWLREQK